MRRVSLFIDEDLIAGLDALRAEHGTPHAESVRRAIKAYLEEKGVLRKPSARKTAPKSKRG